MTGPPTNAACKGTPPQWWFPNKPDPTQFGSTKSIPYRNAHAEYTRNVARAIAICNTCPAQDPCHDYTQTLAQATTLHGIWHGHNYGFGK